VIPGERAERRVLATAALDPLAERLQGAVRRALEPLLGGRLMNALHGTWLGHPLHPALTDLPIGCWAAAVVLDATRAGGGRRPTAVDVVSGFGLAGAVAAASAGAADWSRSGPVGRRIGLAHAGANLGATALSAAALVGRQGARARRMRLAGLMLGACGAWLGGQLVYGESLGVDHGTGIPGPEEWSDAIAVSALPDGRPVRTMVGELPVLLVRRGDEIRAIGDVCSHLGGPLSEGTLDGDTVTCPWHGSRFRLDDGAVVCGPATFRQPCLAVRVREGRVEVREPLPGAPL
jgi:nitrite reductase/ring-hydroxylating ferredoxin subunit/uncharacterized membrane protein